MKRIALNQGKFAIVDDGDLALVGVSSSTINHIVHGQSWRLV